MTDVEARLRAALHDTLDPVGADPARARPAIRAARRGRALRVVTAVVATSVVAAAAVSTPWRDGRPRPAADSADVGAFVASFGRHGQATVVVDVVKSQLCVDLTSVRARYGAVVRYDVQGPDDPRVGSFDSTIRARGAPACTTVDEAAARRLVREPRLHYLEVDPGESGRASALAPLDVEPQYAPDRLEVVCSQTGAVALAPEVQPRLDGVHLRIHDQDGAWDQVTIRPAGGGTIGMRLTPVGPLENATSLAPGTYSIACFRDGAEPGFEPPDATRYATFSVADPNDLWNDAELACDATRQLREIVTDEPIGIPSVPPDFDLLARDHVPGLRPGDELERPTYPESATRREARTVVRDGVRIATLYFSRGHGRWSILPVVCDGSGIGG